MSKNLSIKYYQGNKERLQQKTSKRYQNISKKENDKMWQFDHESYKNLSEDEKQACKKKKKIL